MNSHRPDRPAAQLFRGGAVGATTAVLAVAGHGLAGGGLPPSAALTLLVLCCAGAGALAAGIGGGGRLALVATLAGGQLAGHFALSSVIAHQHVQPGASATTMLAAHAAATVLCAALILAAERLCGPLTRVLRVVLHEPAPQPPPLRVRPVPAGAGVLPHLLLHHVVSRRGPPVTAIA